MTGEEATLARVANCPTSRATNCTSLRGELLSARIHSKTMGTCMWTNNACWPPGQRGERDASEWSRRRESNPHGE